MLNIAKVQELEGNYHGAVKQYNKAIKQDSDNISPRFCLAVLYDNYDMFDEALEEYKGVLDRKPDHLKALLNMGNLYVQLGDNDQAIELFKKVITLDPDNADACNQLGSVYKSVENYAEASAAYKRLLSLNPFQEEAHMALAETQYFQYRSKFNGVKKEEVRQRLDYLLTLNPDNWKGKKLLTELIEDDRILNNGSS
jgi:tetratricopeptide (TPR) repeat protein